MDLAEQFLKKLGLTFEELDSPGHFGEREEYFRLLQQSQTTAVGIEDLKSSIIRMRHSVEMELTDPKHDKKDDDFLKARLRNYILLETTLYSPKVAGEEHKRDIEAMVSDRK